MREVKLLGTTGRMTWKRVGKIIEIVGGIWQVAGKEKDMTENTEREASLRNNK